MIENPPNIPDRHQNLIFVSLGHAQFLQKSSSKFIHNSLSNPADNNRLPKRRNLRRFTMVKVVQLLTVFMPVYYTRLFHHEGRMEE